MQEKPIDKKFAEKYNLITKNYEFPFRGKSHEVSEFFKIANLTTCHKTFFCMLFQK